jgi:DNA-binding CsgD family transcriptional regulator
MRGHAEGGPTRTAAPADPAGARDAEIYDRHAPTVYGQARLMLGDERLARRVARDAIVAECALPPASPRDADRVSARLAVSTLRRCQELMAVRAREDRAATGRHARGRSARQDSQATEQALLGLVLFGGMGYQEAARELAISPGTAAAMLRSALLKLRDSAQEPRTPLPAAGEGMLAAPPAQHGNMTAQ